ncbi:MAG TPA: hypothetical protein VK233_05505 [Candidatus Dormibacteraeota bacterium]|nr:hypothetical protein [Candidatus Dormibacteraeota bacterium]
MNRLPAVAGSGLYRPAPSCENRQTNEHPWRITMDKKAKNPKKPKQTKTKDGASKGK